MGKRWWLVLGAVVGGVIAGVVAWTLTGGELFAPGDWRHGGARFVGAVSALGVMAGYVIARQLTGRPPLVRDGFTLSYGRIEPRPDGYRELATRRVAELVAALEAVGYAPRIEGCDDTGESSGPLDPQTPLAGVNVAIRDPGVRGYIRLQLAEPIEGRPRSLGLLEIWSQRGESAEELALFTLRALDTLLDNLTAARESSRLGEDAVSLLTAGLDDRPLHRRA